MANISVFAILILIFVVGIGAVFLRTVKKRGEVVFDERDDLNPDNRSRFSKVRQLRDDIAKLAQDAPPGSMTRIVAEEAVRESQRVAEQLRSSLLTRQKLEKLRYEESGARMESQSLERKLNSVTSESERVAISGALDAKRLELSHYGELNDLIATIDANTLRAEAALSELKARLSVGLGRDHSEGNPADELRDTLSQLRGLSLSVDEAKSLLAERVTS